MYGQTYLHNTTDTAGVVNGCVWGFKDSNTTGNDFILGEQFVTQFYTIFDSDNEQMGFGVSIYSTTSTGPWLLFSGDSPIPSPSGLSALAITGITVGSVLVAAIIGFALFKFIQSRKAKKGESTDARYSEYLENLDNKSTTDVESPKAKAVAN
jgi:hypothetical protein